MKLIDTFDFTDIESIPRLIKDLLNKDLSDFNDNIFTLKNIQNKMGEKAESFSSNQREILYHELRSQLQGTALSIGQEYNLEVLKNNNTFTITTGHQLNLFSGPVFFIYKILQTIKTCEFLKAKFPNHNFVPIYWMATEDHDFEEINHFKTLLNYYEMNEKYGGAVGRIPVFDIHFISEFESEFRDTVYGTELLLMLKEAYQHGNTLTQAIRILVNRLFSQYGLLMIDGDSKALKSQMIGIFKDELVNSQLKKSTEEKVEFLKNRYGKVQVNPRDINLFYLSETRNRIELQNEEFKVINTDISFSKEEILKELETHPEKFSPNALLRPVFQEVVLPNIVYIGGNAEIMYWLELKDYFKNVKLSFPILIPRNSMLFIKEKTLQKIEKLDLNIGDFLYPFPNIVNKKLLSNHPILDMLQEQEDVLKKQFNQLGNVAGKTHSSFQNMVNAEETRQLKSFQRLKKRLLKAEKIKQQELLERLENLFLEVHPGKTWQERVLNFSVWFSDYGKDWLEICYEKMTVDESQLIVVAI